MRYFRSYRPWMYSGVFSICTWLIVQRPSRITPSWMMSSGVLMSPSTRAVERRRMRREEVIVADDDPLHDDAGGDDVRLHPSLGPDLELVHEKCLALEPAVDAQAPADREPSLEEGFFTDGGVGINIDLHACSPGAPR